MEVDCKNAQIVEMSDFALTVTFKYNSMDYNSLLLLRSALINGFCRNRTSKAKKPRSTGERSQNHHINGHIQQICVETGNDFEAVKMYVKKQAIRRGYPFETFRGEVIPLSESKIDTVQAGYLIDEIHQLADELSIVLME